MKEYLKVANDPVLWLTCMPVVLLIIVQVIIFTKKAFAAGEMVNLTREQGVKAFRVGLVSTIGPALSILVVMLGMMTVVGAPITWLRLSTVGAAPTTLAGAAMGAQAIGVEFGSEQYDATAFASSVWTMTLNGIGWLLIVALFTDKLEIIKEKITGGDAGLASQIGTGAIIGATSFIVSVQLISKGNLIPKNLIVSLTAAVVMIVMMKISEKIKALREWNLGIAMFTAMLIAALFR
jgi:hypothetical protein